MERQQGIETHTGNCKFITKNHNEYYVTSAYREDILNCNLFIFSTYYNQAMRDRFLKLKKKGEK